ncbi:MAG: DnaJ domain-containing protein [Bacillota bacterium]|nr:DnaJ domain-containing protein [Bacillota bacterium]
MQSAKEDAYKIIGVRENASEDEIKKRYAVLLRKYNAAKQNNSQTENIPDIDEINDAYNSLMGLDEKVDTSTRSSKVKNFIYYYKYIFLVSVVALIAIIYTVVSITGYKSPDLSIALTGNFQYLNSDKFIKDIEADIKGVKDPLFTFLPVSKSNKDPREYAFAMKATTMISGHDIDVFILDRENFEKYSKGGVLENLDSIATSLGVDRNSNKDYITSIEGKNDPHLYGIDISNSSMLKDLNMAGSEKIAALLVDTKNRDNAVALLKLLVK